MNMLGHDDICNHSDIELLTHHFEGFDEPRPRAIGIQKWEMLVAGEGQEVGMVWDVVRFSGFLVWLVCHGVTQEDTADTAVARVLGGLFHTLTGSTQIRPADCLLPLSRVLRLYRRRRSLVIVPAATNTNAPGVGTASTPAMVGSA